MPPQLISLALFGLQELIQNEPEIAAEIKALLTKTEPTDADWAALHQRVIQKAYADYDPSLAMTGEGTAGAPPSVQPGTNEPSPASVVSIAPSVPAPHPPDVAGNPVL